MEFMIRDRFLGYTENNIIYISLFNAGYITNNCCPTRIIPSFIGCPGITAYALYLHKREIENFVSVPLKLELKLKTCGLQFFTAAFFVLQLHFQGRKLVASLI